MATTISLGVPGPFASSSDFSDFLENDPLNLQRFEEMTQQELDEILRDWNIESPTSNHCSNGNGPRDLEESPGRKSLPQSFAGASSRSPDTSSVILTPSSASLLEYHGDAAPLIEDPEASDSISTTPETTWTTSEDYVHVSQPSERQGLTAGVTPQSFGSSAHLSPAYYSQQASGVALMPALQSTDTSFNTSTSADTWIDQPQPQHQAGTAQFGSLQLPISGPSNDNQIVAHANPFDVAFHDLDSFDTAGVPNVNSWGSYQAHAANGGQYATQMSFDTLDTSLTNAEFPSPSQPFRNTAISQTQQPQTTARPEWASNQIQHDPPSRQGQHSGANVTRSQDTSSLAAQSRTPAKRRSEGLQRLAVPSHGSTGQQARALQPAIPGIPRTSPPASSERRAKGGRVKNTRLQPAARDKSQKMRKTGACWACVFQRDTCPDDGSPCGRCLDKARKGRILYFPCDRSKLTEWKHDFLPTSFISTHQKQAILDTVDKAVARWDEHNGIDVYLTSAYGPALRWKVYEFLPSDRKYLIQYQYLQDVTTGVVHRYEKYSPPFALMKLETSDEHHFETYLDRLMHPSFLWDFGWVFYEEENQFDDFLPRLVAMMCSLYQQTLDTELQQILHKVIRLMMITYIMGHTLTICEPTLFGVFDSIKHSQKPRDVPQQTSPRLATQQLKFFFGIMRDQIFANILNWAQQTLHSSKEKTETWLPAFCVMLGLAMVLEEVQRTMHLQAETSVSLGEKKFEDANTEAVDACVRIDERWALLVGLYQCKYRDRKWSGDGSFGPSTPKLREGCQDCFGAQLHMVLREKREYLESRRDVPLGQANQAKYTSRMVARFLLPFLGLP